MPTDGYFYVQVRKFSTVCELIATHAGTGRLYTNHYGGSKWQGWCNISDSGNAATVGGKSEADFSQNLGSWSSGDIKDLSLAAKSGYAFVNSGVTGVFSSAAVKALSELVPYLMKRYNITAAGVVRHFDLTGKRCPLYYVDSARWAKLKAAVTANASAAPKPLAAGDRVQVVAPYASSAYAKTAAATSAIGTRRYITRIYPNAPYPYRIGTKKGDTSTAATTGFAAASALKKV